MRPDLPRLTRADRRVLGTVAALVLLSFVPGLAGALARLVQEDAPPPPPGAYHAAPRLGSGQTAFEVVGPPAFVAAAIAVALAWEYLEWARRTIDRATAARPDGHAWLGLVLFVAAPAGVPFAVLAAWVAHRVAGDRSPLLVPGLPVPPWASAFVTTYALALGAAVAALARRRARRLDSSGDGVE